MRLSNNVALVTGGGSGIGRGVALRFAHEGAHVVVADIDEPRAQQVATQITDLGFTSTPFYVDVAEDASIRALVQATVEHAGGLTVVVNSAGVDHHGLLPDFSVDEFDRSVAVNLRSVFLTAKWAADAIAASGGGSIVNIASVMAMYSAPGYSAYTAAKAGVIAMTRNLAIELGTQQIRVNAIAPGYIDTALWDQVVASKPDPEHFAEQVRARHPVGRRGRPEDVAAAAAFLASQDAAFITGETLIVDGGLTTRLNTAAAVEGP